MWKSVHIASPDDALGLREAIAHGTLLSDLDDGFTRSSMELKGGLIADVATGQAGDEHALLLTFRRGRTRFRLSMGGLTEPANPQEILRGLRFTD